MLPSEPTLQKSKSAFRNFANTYSLFGLRGSRTEGATESSSPYTCERCVNLRDCGLVSTSLKPGTVYRSSQVVGSQELQCLQLKAVLDLRVMKKPCKKHASATIQKVKQAEYQLMAMVPSRSNSSSTDSLSDVEEVTGMSADLLKLLQARTGTKVCPLCTKDFGLRHNIAVPIYHSDLMPWHMKLRVFKSLPGRTQARALKEVVKFKNPENLVAAAVVDPGVMGPQVLYQLILDHSHAAVAKALRVFCSRHNFPALIHCIHGKDRTGLIVMLLLLICDVPAKLVVADYIQSELQLKEGRDNGELHELDDFLRSDNVIASKAETMVATISHLEEQYGSIKGYYEHIGLTSDEIRDIRGNLMHDPDGPTAKTLDTANRLDEKAVSYEHVERVPEHGNMKAISRSAFQAGETKFLCSVGSLSCFRTVTLSLVG